MVLVSNHQRYLTTAAHCFEFDERIITTGTDNRNQLTIGFEADRDTSVDTVLIREGEYSFSPSSIWVGTDREDNSSMTVSGSGAPAVDMTDVCVSGSSSFYHCSSRVKKIGQKVCPPKLACIHNTFYLRHTIQTLPGDSGAPVFTVSGGRATIIGLMMGVTTTGIRTKVGIAVPIADVLSAFNAQLAAG